MSFFIPIINTILAVAGLVLLFVVIIETPWQVKLLLLTTGWILAQRGLQSIQAANSRTAKPDPTPAPPIRLAYRDGSYKPSTPTEAIDEKTMVGKYRGTTCNLNIATPSTASQSSVVSTVKSDQSSPSQ